MGFKCRLRGQNKDKSSHWDLRGGWNIVQDGGQTLNYKIDLIEPFWVLFWQKVDWRLRHMLKNDFLQKYSTYNNEIWPFCLPSCNKRSLTCKRSCDSNSSTIVNFGQKLKIEKFLNIASFFILQASDYSGCSKCL